MDGDIELVLGGIDAGGWRGRMCHLLRPCLVKRTCEFEQPCGSDEGAGTIKLRNSQRRLRADRSDASRSAPGGHPGPGVPFRPPQSYLGAITRAEKLSVFRHLQLRPGGRRYAFPPYDL